MATASETTLPLFDVYCFVIGDCTRNYVRRVVRVMRNLGSHQLCGVCAETILPDDKRL